TEPMFAGEQLAAFLAPDHRLAATPVLGPADLRDETLLTVPRALNSGLVDWLVAELERSGYHFGRLQETGGADERDQVLSVTAGLGVAILPVSLKDVGEPGVVVVRRPLDPPLTLPDIVVAWRLSPAARLRPVIAKVR